MKLKSFFLWLIVAFTAYIVVDLYVNTPHENTKDFTDPMLVKTADVNEGQAVIEMKDDTVEMCKKHGGCVVVPKAFMRQIGELIATQKHVIESITKKLNKSCA